MLLHGWRPGTTSIQLCCLVVTGTVYGFIRLRQQSTVAAVLAHSCYNLALYLVFGAAFRIECRPPETPRLFSPPAARRICGNLSAEHPNEAGLQDADMFHQKCQTFPPLLGSQEKTTVGGANSCLNRPHAHAFVNHGLKNSVASRASAADLTRTPSSMFLCCAASVNARKRDEVSAHQLRRTWREARQGRRRWKRSAVALSFGRGIQQQLVSLRTCCRTRKRFRRIAASSGLRRHSRTPGHPVLAIPPSCSRAYENFLPLINGVSRNEHASFGAAEQVLHNNRRIAVIRAPSGPVITNWILFSTDDRAATASAIACQTGCQPAWRATLQQEHL